MMYADKQTMIVRTSRTTRTDAGEEISEEELRIRIEAQSVTYELCRRRVLRLSAQLSTPAQLRSRICARLRGDLPRT
ncbi:MAG: hypothetical protein AAF772_03835 [Acidobacteriota bacterium]